MSNAIFGQGSSISRAGNIIAELLDIDGVEMTMDTTETTSHQSTLGIKECVPGNIDPGEVNMAGNFIPGDTNGQIALQTDMINRTLQTFVITSPGGTFTWTFSGYVTQFKTALPSDGKLAFNAKIKISGQPVLGIGASNSITAMALSGSGAWFPSFAAATYEYVYSVATGISSITITPTFAAGVCTITCGSQIMTVASGNASGSITLNGAGSVTTINVTIKETGKNAKTYIIKVARA